MIVNHSSVASVVNIPFQGIYNSSKAATAMMTDTMRLELQPLGIKVVDLKTGSVTSGFFPNQAERVSPILPASSVYLPAREVIEKIMRNGLSGMRFMPSQVWAERVIGDLLKPTPSWHIWRGEYATGS